MFPFSPASESRTRRMREPSELSELSSSRSRSREYYRKDSRDSPPHADRSSNKIAECTFIGGIKVIEIWSEYLVKAIEKVIQYPQLQPIEGFFTEQEPYPTLFYHMKDVETEIAQMDNQVANDHLMTLKIEIDYIVPTWNEAREEKFTDKLVSYGMIWKYFRPGDLVLGEDDLGNLWLLGLIKISRSILRDRRPDKEEGKREERISFDTWVLAWNEADDDLERKYATFTCSEFSGKRHITSLPIYPIRYLEEKTRENIEANLAKRGRKWKKLITAASICQYHSGLAFIPEGGRAVGEKFRADGRIVIDVHSKNPPLISDIFESAKRPLEHQVPYTRRHVNEEPWRERISVSATLTDDQAMLCPAMIRCHDLRSKKRYFVSVDNLQPIEWNKDAMDHLVLDTRKKDMLKGLVSYHSSRNRGNEKADIIAGKGQSLVILLHGPPGVGKTLTAESTAEAVGKPLIAMSIGEMVWDETQLQERLRTEFQRAVDWDAVLLLDEADVVLEARSFEDVRRNGIVSIFLRELEYYRGSYS